MLKQAKISYTIASIMKWSVRLRLILHTLSLGPQLYLVSSRKYSLLSLKHWKLEYTEHGNVGTFIQYTAIFKFMQSKYM